MHRLPSRVLALVLWSTALSAHASGFYFGDNGAKALAQGGAFTGQADDLTAIQHNPAGLAQLEGPSFLLDVNGLNHQVSFLRQDVGWDPAAPRTNLAAKVENKGGLFVVPFLGGSYGLKLGSRTLTVGLGVYGPPAVGRYGFPAPDYTRDANGKYQANPVKSAPNRYALINNDILIVYPSLSAAIDVHPKVLVGASLQLVLSNFMLRQALYSGLSTPAKLTEEDPIFDSVVTVNLAGRPVVTGIFGVLWKPTDTLAFGASYRPRIPLVATGSLDIALGEAAKGLNTVVTGDQAMLTLTLPVEIRAGVQFHPFEKLRLLGDVVYQGWHSVKEMTLSPMDVTMKVGSGEPQLVSAMHIPKNWVATWSGRVGASYDLLPLLTAHAGALYETSASPDQFFSIDFAHPARAFVTLGASVHLAQFDVVLAGAYSPAVTTTVQDSQVRQGQTDSTVTGSVIGNGLYTSGGWIASLGVRGHFGPQKAQAGATPTQSPRLRPG